MSIYNMSYRVIKRKGFNGEDVYECQHNGHGFFNTIQTRNFNASFWDVWCGNNVKSAIFKTEEEAVQFLKKYAASFEETEVFKM